jgi:hypothetical protein
LSNWERVDQQSDAASPEQIKQLEIESKFFETPSPHAQSKAYHPQSILFLICVLQSVCPANWFFPANFFFSLSCFLSCFSAKNRK